MATLDGLFKEYLARIEPDAKAVERAATAHDGLRTDLEKDETYGPYIAKTMLSGSYGRQTAILGIKDVDVIVQTTFTEAMLEDMATEDESPQYCLLRLTREAIERTGRAASTKPNRRSIQVGVADGVNDITPKNPALTLDIVPVLAVHGMDVDPMTIADRDLDEWYTTYPRGQCDDSEARNLASSYIVDRRSYKPLVKLLKAWKRVHFYHNRTPKGFVLECLCARYHNPIAAHWGESVLDLFKNICGDLPHPDCLSEDTAIPDVPDIANLAPFRIPIAKTIDEAKRVLTRFHKQLELIEQALEEAEADLTKSAKTWRRVFGEPGQEVVFPLPEDLDGESGDKTARSPFVVPKSNVREAYPFGIQRRS